MFVSHCKRVKAVGDRSLWLLDVLEQSGIRAAGRPALTGRVQTASDKDIRDLFDEVDTDGSGTVSMDEYFFWVLGTASRKSDGLGNLFRNYDTSKEGTLDAMEFNRACEDMGFTEVSHELFLEVATCYAPLVVSTAITLCLLSRPTDRTRHTCHAPLSSTRTCLAQSRIANSSR